MPGLHISGEEELYTEVNRVCDVIGKNQGVSFSSHSRVLIANTLIAARDDPHPYWAETDTQRLEQFHDIVGSLPERVQQLATAAAASKEVTFFGVLHWFGTNLDAICPFSK